MKTGKKVSVIIPVYNAEKYIKECIQSVLEQDYDNMEVIVINDGSTDASEKNLAEFMDEIVYIKQKNAGGSAARNTGLKAATGDYVFFLDADDILFSKAINELIKGIGDADICIGNYVEINDKGEAIKEVRAFSKKTSYSMENLPLLYVIYPNPSTKLYRMDIIKKNGLSFANLPIAQDLNFYLKYLLCCSRAVGINEMIYGYRIVQGSISRTYDSRIKDITKSFDDVELFAERNGKISVFKQHIENVELMHICYQMHKLRCIKSNRDRFEVFNFLKKRILELSPNRLSLTYEKTKPFIVKLAVYTRAFTLINALLRFWHANEKSGGGNEKRQ